MRRYEKTARSWSNCFSKFSAGKPPFFNFITGNRILHKILKIKERGFGLRKFFFSQSSNYAYTRGDDVIHAFEELHGSGLWYCLIFRLPAGSEVLTLARDFHEKT